MSHLPSDAEARKRVPIATGVIDYFPKALAAVAAVSLAGNEQHHPGSHLHWDRSKSTDESDALIRHFFERGTRDTDGHRHSAKVAWRALALLEKEIESDEAQVELSGSNDPPNMPEWLCPSLRAVMRRSIPETPVHAEWMRQDDGQGEAA